MNLTRLAFVTLMACKIHTWVKQLNQWSAMSGRFVFCAVWAAVSSMPSVLYADQQACEALVAVSYLDASFDAANALDKETQHRLNGDVLKTLAQKTQLNISIDSAQDVKALADVRSGRVDLIIGVSQQADTDARLDYLKPAYAQKTYRLWLRTGEQLSLKQWPELRGLRGMRVLGPKQFADFDEQAQRRNWPVRSVDTLDIAIDRILQGRADYVLAEQVSFLQLLVEKELAQRFEFIEPAVKTERFFLALSKDSACNNAELRSTLNKVLLTLTEQQ